MKYNSITSITGQEQDPPIIKDPTSIEFLRKAKAFAHWLRLINFDGGTIKYAQKNTHEFLGWLETQGITDISGITRQTTTDYFDYLLQRKNKRNGGRLSKNTLRSHLTNLRRFARYLRESGQDSFEVSMRITGKLQNIKEIFTRSEIQALYEGAGSDILGLRDRAMLAVYYGCGLRRSEGISLDVKDVLLERNLLYVRQGKNYKERYVPMSEGVREDLKTYIESARPILLKQPTHALFLTQYGTRMIGESMLERLRQLKEKSGIDKDAALHSLRHSIATHLLQSGMELEKIKHFLGHSSLESTQIYTHIINDIIS